MRMFYESIPHAVGLAKSQGLPGESVEDTMLRLVVDAGVGAHSDLLVMAAFVAMWYEEGCPVFRLSESSADAIAFTDSPSRHDSPFRVFGFELPFPVHAGNGDFKFGLAGVRGINRGESRNRGWVALLANNTGWSVTDGNDVVDHMLSGLCGLLSAGAKKTPGAKKGKHTLPARRSKAPVNVWIVDPPIRTAIPLSSSADSLRSGRLPEKQFKIGKRFMVRGHWRNQACGKGMTDRKHMWVSPYLKGPDDAAAWSRVYEVAQ